MERLDLHVTLREMDCEIPIIYVTATSDGALRKRAFRQGAAAFLAKPFDDEELLTAIHSSLNGSRAAAAPTRCDGLQS
jgi:FixJ family two-component response regulator